MEDLGWANSWKEEPELVRKCDEACDAGDCHELFFETIGNCLTRVTCKTCGYTYQIDSGD
jgi:hypothetical protein